MTEFLEVASSDEFNINLYDQQPNSPNMNVLDLGLLELFNHFSIKKHLQQLDDLVNAIEKAFHDLPS